MGKVASGRTRRHGVQRDVMDAVLRRLAAGETYTGLGVQAICDEAGVARSAFYKNFADKTDLLVRLVESSTEDLFAVSQAWATGSGGLDSMIAGHRNSVRVWRENAPLLRAYFEIAAQDEQVAEFWSRGMRDIVDLMDARIASGQTAGVITRRLRARALAEFIVYGFERRTAQHIATTDASEDDAFAAELAEIGWVLMYGPDSDSGAARRPGTEQSG